MSRVFYGRIIVNVYADSDDIRNKEPELFEKFYKVGDAVEQSVTRGSMCKFPPFQIEVEEE